MGIGIGIGLRLGGRGAASPITSTGFALGPLTDGGTLADGVTWGTDASAAGTIASSVQEMQANGGAWEAYNGTTATDAGVVWRIRKTVTDSAGNVRVFTSPARTVAYIPLVRTANPSLAGNWIEGATITVTAGTYTGTDPVVVTTVYVDTDGDDDDDGEVTLTSGQFVIPTPADGYRYRLIETASNPNETLTFDTGWGPVVAEVAITATVAPVMSRLYEGQSVNDITSYATFAGLGNYASTAGAISTVVAAATGAPALVTTPTVEGQLAGATFTVTDAASNVKIFIADEIEVEYKARIAATVGNEAQIDINPLVPDGETISLTVTGGAYAGTYSAIPVEDVRGTAAPYNFADTAEITYTGTPEDLVATDTMSLDLGLWAITKGTLAFTAYQWKRNGTNISGATSATYPLVSGDIGATLTCAITASDGTDTTTVTTAGVLVGAATTPVFSVGGQSNALGTPPYDGLGTWPTGTYEWVGSSRVNRSGTSTPLGAADAGTMSFLLQFATRWIAANGGEITFVQGAQGGTGFSDNRWNPGDDLYNALVSKTNACLAADATRRLESLLFIQGSGDSETAADAEAYHDALYDMVTGLRGAITGASNVPFVLGGVPTTINRNYKWAAVVDSAQELLYQRLDRVKYVNTDGLTFETPGLPIHWDAPAHRIIGDRFYDALAAGVNSTANAGAGTPTVDQVQHTFATTTGTTTTLATTVTVTSGQSVYVVIAAGRTQEVSAVTIGGQPAIEVYGQVDYNAGQSANENDGLFFFKLENAPAMSSPSVVVTHALTGLRVGCATFVVNGASFDRIKAVTDYSVNSTAVTIPPLTFTTNKTALVIAAGIASSGSTGFTAETLSNVVVSTGIDPSVLTHNWTVSYQTYGAGASVSAGATYTSSATGQQFGSIFAALLIE